MKLYLSDLKLIDSLVDEDKQGFCVFTCKPSTAVFNFLLIRSILEENGFGRLSLNNVVGSETTETVQINTNLLYCQYKQLQENETKEQLND